MQQESQGHLEAKVKKQRASPSSVLRVFFFSIYLQILVPEQHLKSQNFKEFYIGIQGNLFDSNPQLCSLSMLISVKCFPFENLYINPRTSKRLFIPPGKICSSSFLESCDQGPE